MSETNQIENNQSLKIQLSLASLMFFSPFVHMMLNRYTFEITEEEIGFVKGYMRLGWMCIGLLAIGMTLDIVNYSVASSLLDMLYMATMSVLIVILIGGCIGIFTDTSLIKVAGEKKDGFVSQSIDVDPKDMLLNYVPLYDLYRRYQLHTFDKPNLIIKESLLVWPLFGIICSRGNMTAFSFALILIVIRVVTLMSQTDIIPPKVSAFVNKLFYKNPEELRGYVTGTLVFIVRSLFHKPCSWSDCIVDAKQPYTYLYDIRKFGIIQWQYALVIVGIGFAYWKLGWQPATTFDYIAISLVVGRYLVMFMVRKHLPAIPGIREIVDGVYRFFHLFTSRSS